MSMMSSIQMSCRMVSIIFPIYYYQTMYFIYVDMEALRIVWLTMALDHGDETEKTTPEEIDYSEVVPGVELSYVLQKSEGILMRI
ncbi:hypothetical protein VNO80_03359 [Phaseolus coccineus]|uniref:Uncharacterized protein n=1 Tax=Phaseolus coccineus TaxID=3886 RepID=A0AAN9NR79_PHACN